jgi:hypothetical protein
MFKQFFDVKGNKNLHVVAVVPQRAVEGVYGEAVVDVTKKCCFSLIVEFIMTLK